MGKDPALLWYFSDWNGGTMTMSRHLKGCYMDILSAQFFNGPLSLDEIKTVLGSDFGTAWPTIQKKFTKSSEGLFFNERLQQEKLKRANFSESRRKNAKSSATASDKHMHKHMENRNRNENIIENDKGGVGENHPLSSGDGRGEAKVGSSPSGEAGVRSIGSPNGHRITVKTKYLHEPNLIVHDLEEYFLQQGQLEEIQKAGWIDFKGFMKTNPAAIFNDQGHLYNAFKNHCTKPRNGAPSNSKRDILKNL